MFVGAWRCIFISLNASWDAPCLAVAVLACAWRGGGRGHFRGYSGRVSVARRKLPVPGGSCSCFHIKPGALQCKCSFIFVCSPYDHWSCWITNEILHNYGMFTQLSPLSFSLNVNDMEEQLLMNNCDYVTIEDKWIDDMLKILVLK